MSLLQYWSREILIQIEGFSSRVRQGLGDTEPVCRLKLKGHKRHKKEHRIGKTPNQETRFVTFVLFVVSVASCAFCGECRALLHITFCRLNVITDCKFCKGFE